MAKSYTGGPRLRYDAAQVTMSNKPVRKAVFPAAGLGTRFLPATKAQPKEMLPLVDKPIIQYGVEEALASGVHNIILVTGRGKNAIEDHFDVSVELETFLEARGKKDLLAEIRNISNLMNVSYVRQGEPLGLGHAVLVTKDLIGDEPFAVILGDDVIDAKPPALRQMIDVFHEVGGPVLAIEQVPRRERQLLRHHRRRGDPSGRLSHPGYGGETAARRGAVEPRHHRALRADARHLPGARRDRARKGSDRGDPADQRAAPPAEDAADLRLQGRWRAPRHGEQAGVPEGRRLLRAAPAGPGGAVPRVPARARPRRSCRDAPLDVAFASQSAVLEPPRPSVYSFLADGFDSVEEDFASDDLLSEDLLSDDFDSEDPDAEDSPPLLDFDPASDDDFFA